MALVKNQNHIAIATTGGAAFDTDHSPGTKVPHSGIYRCTGCGDEVTCNKGDPLPPQNHHQHPNRTAINWRLLVFTQTKGS